LKYDNNNYGIINKDWHSSDSFYKFSKIYHELEAFIRTFKKNEIIILDVGSGAGIIGKLFCEFFVSRGITVVFDTVEPNTKLVEVYKEKNSFFRRNFLSWELIDTEYDLCLCFDVVEHIQDDTGFISKLADVSDFGFFNIPVEINLVDFLRSFYVKNYYKMQEESLGHLHFYSFKTAKKILSEVSVELKTTFQPYSEIVLLVASHSHEKQLSSKLRWIELYISKWIHNFIPYIPRYIIQGSMYSAVRFK
jgi:hypothetical protein